MLKRLILIGILFCLGGLSAIWSIVQSFMHGEININFAVLLLPVGIGLLQGKSRSHSWATIWLILGIVLAGLGIFFAGANPDATYFHSFDDTISGSAAVPRVQSALVLSMGFMLLLLVLLYTRKTTNYIQAKKAQADYGARPPPVDSQGPTSEPL